jgi:hypothetical protein
MSSARPSAYYSGLFFAVLFAIAVLAKLDQPFDWEAARDARMDPDPGFEQAAPRGCPSMSWDPRTMSTSLVKSESSASWMA